MGLIFWWMLIAWALVIIIYWAVRYYFFAATKRMTAANALPVAHSNRLTNLPIYITVLKRYRLLMSWIVSLLSLCLLTAIVLSARPATVSVVTPTQQNRDIMLCLDASGSVLRADTALLNRFTALVNGFSGQRFGLTLFNSSAVNIIPMNDNYKVTGQQLKNAAAAFKAQKGDAFTQLTDGTLADFESGTSLVSDGLLSCIEHISVNAQHRSQSIILATDNEVNGTPIVSMTQVVAIARQRNIHIFAIDPGISDQQLSGDHTQLQIISKETGGNYYQITDNQALNAIVDGIAAQESSSFVGLPQPAVNDAPRIFLYIAAIMAIASTILLWRLEL